MKYFCGLALESGTACVMEQAAESRPVRQTVRGQVLVRDLLVSSRSTFGELLDSPERIATHTLSK